MTPSSNRLRHLKWERFWAPYRRYWRCLIISNECSGTSKLKWVSPTRDELTNTVRDFTRFCPGTSLSWMELAEECDACDSCASGPSSGRSHSHLLRPV